MIEQWLVNIPMFFKPAIMAALIVFVLSSTIGSMVVIDIGGDKDDWARTGRTVLIITASGFVLGLAITIAVIIGGSL